MFYEHRLSLIWKHGGVYSDLDRITTDSFEPLLNIDTNGFNANNWTFMIFNRIKHPLLAHMIKQLPIDPIDLPQLVRKASKHFCDSETFNFFNRMRLLTYGYDCMDSVFLPHSCIRSIRFESTNKSSFNENLNKTFSKNIVENCELTFQYAKMSGLDFF